MKVPARGNGGDQQELIFPPIDTNTATPVEKKLVDEFGELVVKKFRSPDAHCVECPNCNSATTHWNRANEVWICSWTGCSKTYTADEMKKLRIQEKSEDESPLDVTLTHEGNEVSGESEPASDVMLELSKKVYCAHCAVQGALWSKIRSKWECHVCVNPAFGKLCYTRYFVGNLDVLRDLASPLFQKPVIQYVRKNDGPVAEARGPKIKLFSLDFAHSIHNNERSDGGENAQRFKIATKRLIRTGNTRPFSQFMADWSQQLDLFSEEHPNFVEVIEMNVRPSLAVLAAGGQVRAAPILLYGDPGVGKSYFAQRLGKIIASPFTKVDIATSQSGSSLTGSSAFWANTEPGRLFNTLIFGIDGIAPTIDPILFLDEVDKVSADRYDPLGGLYSLLEIESAKHFEDESYPGLELNAGFVRWILAANDQEKIPPPLRSRCQEFSIPKLSESQKEKTYSRIFENVVRECQLPDFDQCLREKILAELIEMGIREFKTSCSVAVGRALSNGRSMVELNDFRSPGVGESRRQRIGFLP